MGQVSRSRPRGWRRRSAGRSVVLVGMMGAGKTSVGKRLAARLGLPFADADAEIEAGAQLTISEIFERFGEPYFREGERKVIARLLNDGPQVLATGGGAFMNPATRDAIAAQGFSVWLKPELRRPARPGAQEVQPAIAQDRGPGTDAAAPARRALADLCAGRLHRRIASTARMMRWSTPSLRRLARGAVQGRSSGFAHGPAQSRWRSARAPIRS